MNYERPFRKKVKKIMHTILNSFLTTQSLLKERREMPSYGAGKISKVEGREDGRLQLEQVAQEV